MFFSIVIPTYNRAHLLPKTIESVLAQTFQDFEIVMVDDGSKDATEQTIAAMNCPKIRYFKKENGERGAARNYGAQRAQGRYVTFLDSDDLFYPEHLQKAYDLITGNPDKVFFFLPYDIVSPTGEIEIPAPHFSGDLNEKLAAEGNFMSCHGVFLQREVALKHPFIEDRRMAAHEDYELWLRLAALYPLVYANGASNALVNHEGRSVLNMDKSRLEERLNIFLENLFKDKPFMAKYGRYRQHLVADSYTYIALHLALTKKNRAAALGYLFKAFFAEPAILKQRRFWGTLKHLA